MKHIRRIKSLITVALMLVIGYVGYLMITGGDTSFVNEIAEKAQSTQANIILKQVFPDIPDTELDTAINGVKIKNNAKESRLTYDVPSVCPESFNIEELAAFSIDVKIDYVQNNDICEMNVIYTKGEDE